ncbi:hypothetical protein TWF569_002108 [Orbilia oligospora]|uniref:Uncharacterized protein n=1 Tax=Orbilia oligospora TaxID=2813651 RepID=A0A7C8JI46_ORBOL|nr:hypothetical protein TWF703_004944 [Orbilia oligospora]KAF3122569.1 hypothetical protein TWF569_002108 [Orbilia oligospora]KAF3127659.1 hypothetical protein TWF594_000596 [Orbilia oligospora]
MASHDERRRSSRNSISSSDAELIRDHSRRLGLASSSASSASSQLLDPSTVGALSSHFDQLLGAIAGRIESVYHSCRSKPESPLNKATDSTYPLSTKPQPKSKGSKKYYIRSTSSSSNSTAFVVYKKLYQTSNHEWQLSNEDLEDDAGLQQPSARQTYWPLPPP